ncbi:MAG: ferrochelatase [Bryobacteraceae bacterium]
MYDALLLVSFGGPETSEDVMPFLENVTRGRNIPRERLAEVAEHYYHFGGKSPINDQNRALIAALQSELKNGGIDLPIYWGNRNWKPYLTDALLTMRTDGVKNALAFVTSGYSSYSGCRQYRENVAAAQAEVGEGAPKVDKLRVFYNHPGFIDACAERVREAMEQLPRPASSASGKGERPRLVATAHSIPSSMAETSNYKRQLRETARLVAERLGFEDWDLVFQSRSGPPTQPWLGPDILDHLRSLAGQNVRKVVVSPLGFLSDHMEVLYDLDTEAAELAAELGITMVRAKTVGTHPSFVRMIVQLVRERISPDEPKLAIGQFGPNHDLCPVDCCPAPQRAGRPPVSADPVVSLQP